MSDDDRDMLAARATTIAAKLSTAVDNSDAEAVEKILNPLSRDEMNALAVVLAAHVDVPIVETKRSSEAVDWAVVERVVDGDAKMAKIATRAERVIITSRWLQTGRSLNELERVTGWKPERYGRAAVCGTDSGYHHHRRSLHEPPCEACRTAHNEAERDRVARRRLEVA